MSRINLFTGCSVAAVIAAGFLAGLSAQEQPDATKVRPKFTVSKETTYVTEPLTKDGWPDNVAAINQQLSAGVTPQNNAAVPLYRALGPALDGTEQPERFFELLGMPKPPAAGDYLTNIGTYLQSQTAVRPGDAAFDEVLEQQGRATMRPWSAQQSPHIAGWLKANEQPLALVVEATQRPRYYSPLVIPAGEEEEALGLIGVLLPGVQQSREMARLLCARAMLNLHDGRIDAAWQDLLACHRLGRLTGRGATLIEGLVGVAIETMAIGGELAFIEHAKPGPAEAARYLADLDQLPPPPSMTDQIDLGERFMFLDSVLMVARGGPEAMQLFDAEDFVGKFLARLSLNAIDWDVVLRMGNDWYNRIVAAMRKADRRERVEALEEFNEKLKEFMADSRGPEGLQKLLARANTPQQAVSQLVGRIMVGLLLPAVAQAREAEDRVVQRLQNLRVAMALAAYRSDHGRYPQTLRELAPNYLKEIPGDLFSGKPLIYKPQAEGYLLYSVSSNGEDDGGFAQGDGPQPDDLHVMMPLPAENR